ncbi:hypothetical protein ACTFIU_000042 [Dictyostelium citrinum]
MSSWQPSTLKVYDSNYSRFFSLLSTLKNNGTDLLIVEKRSNDTLKYLLLMLTMMTHDSTNVDVELITYLAESAIILAVNVQESLRHDTPKMIEETESEGKRKLSKSIKNNKEANQLLLNLYSQSKSTFKKSSGCNANGNSSSNLEI